MQIPDKSMLDDNETQQSTERSFTKHVVLVLSISSVLSAAALACMVSVWVCLGEELEELKKNYERLDTLQDLGEDYSAIEEAIKVRLAERLRGQEDEITHRDLWLRTNDSSGLRSGNGRDAKPLAHLTGSPQLAFEKGEPTGGYGLTKIRQWEAQQGLATVANGMGYKEGSLVIPQDGLYFVYSQLYYRFLRPADYSTSEKRSSTLQLIHYTFKKDSYPKPQDIMKSSRSTCWSKREEFGLYTSYQGGVFRLRKEDRLWVAISDVSLVSLEEAASYFGAFMI